MEAACRGLGGWEDGGGWGWGLQYPGEQGEGGSALEERGYRSMGRWGPPGGGGEAGLSCPFYKFFS